MCLKENSVFSLMHVLVTSEILEPLVLIYKLVISSLEYIGPPKCYIFLKYRALIIME